LNKLVGTLWLLALLQPMYNWNIVESGVKHHVNAKKSSHQCYIDEKQSTYFGVLPVMESFERM
jgi:hypothetical protein